MRPAESTSFCVPVKNGWQFEQISTRISPFVERVFHSAPHAQWTFTTSYFGWIPFLTFLFLGRDRFRSNLSVGIRRRAADSSRMQWIEPLRSRAEACPNKLGAEADSLGRSDTGVWGAEHGIRPVSCGPPPKE